jgi:tripartite-type tricarboxylate transporter receptor subunit TctC
MMRPDAQRRARKRSLVASFMGRVRGLAAMLLALGISAAFAQEYPVRPVRIIVPFAAGGPADIYARFIGQRLQEVFRQPVVVDNRPGAGAIIGTDAVAKAAPDGYTLLLMSNTHTINETLIPAKPYALLRDLVPVAPINYSDLVLVVHPKVAANTLEDLLKQARATPGKLTYASWGPVRRITWPANSSRRWRASTSCTCRIAAARARAPT